MVVSPPSECATTAELENVPLRGKPCDSLLSLGFMSALPVVLIIGMGNGCLPSRSPLSCCSGSFPGSFRITAMATTIMRSRVWCWNGRTAQLPKLNLQNCATPELSSSRRYIPKTFVSHYSALCREGLSCALDLGRWLWL